MDEKNNDILDDLEHDEFEDDYQVDEDGDWVCMCDNCVHNSNNWEDGHWIGGDY